MARDHGLEAAIPARLIAAGQRLTRREGRSFGLVVGGAFLALGGLVWWRGHPLPASVAGTLGGLLVLAGLVVPVHLGPVQRAWMKLALLISKVTTPIFMGVIFFVVITPAGLLARAFGHRPLVRRGDSTWVMRRDGGRSNLQRQF